MANDPFRDAVATECLTCRFWQPEDQPEEPTLGECRLCAPESSLWLENRTGPERAAWLPLRGWPLTDSRDWCLSWRHAA
jgi:hypothetical protein